MENHDNRNNTKDSNSLKISFYRRLSFIGIPALAAVLAFVLFFTGIFPGARPAKVKASDLMKEVSPKQVTDVKLTNEFIQSSANFSLELFKQSYSKSENSLVSPTSVLLALGMTANGADGNTLKEFEAILGKSGLTINDLNANYNSMSKDLTKVESGKVTLANSIWYRKNDRLTVNKDFLQANADYYRASAYEADFDSKDTVKDINNWVKNNTGNLIDKIIDKIDSNSLMYLINTLYFEDEWKNIYNKQDVHNGSFKMPDGTAKSVEFMYSDEYSYLSDNNAEGFIKPYKSGKYSFVALLPKEGITLDSYISTLSGQNFIDLLKNKTNEPVRAGLPRFKSEYKVDLVNPLKNMGLKDCFDPAKANFSKMGSSSAGNLFVGDVLHKTFITVDTKGTKAGAVTVVEMKDSAHAKTHEIFLNRPFVYAIVDNTTNLPLFIGTMVNPEM